MSGSARRAVAARVSIAVLLVTALVSVGTSSRAAPTIRDVREARARLDALNGELSVLVESYNLARLRLEDVERRLSDTKVQIARANDRVARADAALDRVAAAAFQEPPSQLVAILEASSLADLTARLEFSEQIARANADLETEAENARQDARWLAEELAGELAERRATFAEVAGRREAIEAKIAQATAILEDVEDRYQDALAAERAAAEAAAAAQAAADASGWAGVSSPPPVVAGSVDAVIEAARSVVGAPYVFGAADPEIGFDCSGLTMWAWAHGGVSLPHSSTTQYNVLPHVDRSDIQPGDLIFSSYGRLGSGVVDHVALYIGGGQTIAATNPTTGVAYRPIDWDAYVGAARPG